MSGRGGFVRVGGVALALALATLASFVPASIALGETHRPTWSDRERRTSGPEPMDAGDAASRHARAMADDPPQRASRLSRPARPQPAHGGWGARGGHVTRGGSGREGLGASPPRLRRRLLGVDVDAAEAEAAGEPSLLLWPALGDIPLGSAMQRVRAHPPRRARRGGLRRASTPTAVVARRVAADARDARRRQLEQGVRRPRRGRRHARRRRHVHRRRELRRGRVGARGGKGHGNDIRNDIGNDIENLRGRVLPVLPRERDAGHHLGVRAAPPRRAREAPPDGNGDDGWNTPVRRGGGAGGVRARRGRRDVSRQTRRRGAERTVMEPSAPVSCPKNLRFPSHVRETPLQTPPNAHRTLTERSPNARRTLTATSTFTLVERSPRPRPSRSPRPRPSHLFLPPRLEDIARASAPLVPPRAVVPAPSAPLRRASTSLLLPKLGRFLRVRVRRLFRVARFSLPSPDPPPARLRPRRYAGRWLRCGSAGCFDRLTSCLSRLRSSGLSSKCAARRSLFRSSVLSSRTCASRTAERPTDRAASSARYLSASTASLRRRSKGLISSAAAAPAAPPLASSAARTAPTPPTRRVRRA